MTRSFIESANLLIADRSIDDRVAIESALSPKTWSVTHAERARDAIRLCKEKQFDVVIVEADPLDARAIDTIAEIRFGEGLSNHAAIIAISSFIPGAFDCLTVRAGADLHIAKPIPKHDVAVHISTASILRLEAHHRF